MSASITYASYLKIPELLSLQKTESEPVEHDEMLFIVIHQVYELWFKQILHELDYLSALFATNDTSRALHTLRRILTILKTAVGQIDILETMTPLEFLSFRDFLQSASGFQSAQFRELEFVLGHKRRSVMQYHPEGSLGRESLERRYQARTLWDAFLALLADSGYAVPETMLARDVTQPVEASERLQEILLQVYTEEESLSRVCERLVDFDEGLQEWRYRHVMMVQRTIGMKQGTGGSSGAEYLRTTLFRPVFPDLWAIRSRLTKNDRA